MFPKWMRDYGIAVVVAVVVAAVIRSLLIEAYRIPSSAMRPTLRSGDTILVAKWPFRFSSRMPERGEVVIFAHSETRREYVKRVVGLPGDLVEIRNGKLFLNGKNLTYPGGSASDLCGMESLEGRQYQVCWEPPLLQRVGPTRVPAGSVFMLGDLRSSKGSHEGASWAVVPASDLKAKALWVWLSIEPLDFGGHSSWFSRIRFERMFEPIR